MIGFLIGTACLIGLIATLKRGRCGRAYAGGCGGYGWGGGYGWKRGCHHGHGDHGHPHGEPHHHEERGPWGPYRGGFRHGFGPRGFVSMLSRRLDLTPAQEKVFFQAFDEIRDAVRKGRGELRETRRDVAKAFRASSFDAVLLGELFSRHDDVLDEVRKAVTGALGRVHESLDERQREKLAAILEEGWW